MKSIALSLIGFICCFTVGYTQNYFYDEDRPIRTTTDLEYKVVHFRNSESYQSFLRLVSEELKIEKRIEKYHAVVVSIKGNKNPDLYLSEIFSIEGIRDETFALELEDGFNLYLSYELLLEPRYGINLENTSIIKHAIYNGARLYQDEYNAYHLAVEHPMASLEISNALVEANLVNWAHPNFYSNHEKYSDPLYSQQFQMNNTGQTISGVSGLNDVDCDAPEAWAITTGSDQIKVAVIDDGVEDHPDLEDASGNSRLEPGNTPANGGDGTPSTSNDGHGVACTGIITASHNSIHVRGVAPHSKIIPVNIFQGSETISDIANAFNYARTNGADVISNSWGYTSCTLSLSALNSAISNARNNGRGGLGCVVIFAAGNGYKSCVDYPADLDYVMAVGAVTSLGEISAYSNTGPALDVVAPSNSAPGQSGPGVRTIDRVGFAGYSSGSSTNGFGGTSAACPVVSGCAALLLSFDPGLTEAEVRTILEDTATDMGASGFDNTFGHGRVSAYDALMTLNPGTVPVSCSAVIDQFPYQQGFESGLANWVQTDADNFDWSLNVGGTPSFGTGPGNASEGIQYLYTESSSPNYPTKTATILSPCFDLTALPNPELAFDYHMYGSSMGTLRIEGSTDGLSWTTLAQFTGDQGNFWNTYVLSLADYTAESSFSLRFELTTQNSYTSDAAIDNIEIGVAGTVGNTDPCAEGFIDLFPYLEDFEAGIGNWIQNMDDDMNWILNSGGTPSSGTGPSSASQGNQYLYIETSAPNYPSKSAVIQLSCLDISSLDNPAFYLNYHMNGNSVGSLVLEAKAAEGDWIQILSLSGSQGNSWNNAVVNLSEFSDSNDLQVRITGTSGNSWAGDIAIDALGIGEDISIGESVCASSQGLPFEEGFENGADFWTQDGNDNLDWVIRSGGTPSSQTGPSSAQEGSNYFYIESSSPNYPSKTAIITSPCLDLSQGDDVRLQFYCHMYGSNMGQLTLEARSEEDPNWIALWSQNGEIGNFWQLVEIPLNEYIGASGVQFRFTGTTGNGWRSDIAIDNIEVSVSGETGSSPCPQLNFTGQIVSYGVSQDNGTHTVFSPGDRVDLYDNAWKAHPYAYTITQNTMLEFEFRSINEGEIHGIGFDNDNNISTNFSFQLSGTQNWGIQNFNNYTGTNWVNYSIPVGNYFTGNFDKITLINDNDAGTGNDSRYRNVKVYESGDCNPGILIFSDFSEIVVAGKDSDEQMQIEIYPNPARNQVRVSLPNLQAETAQLRVTDITGKTLLVQKILGPNTEIDVQKFAPGIYIVNAEIDNQTRFAKKLVVTR